MPLHKMTKGALATYGGLAGFSAGRAATLLSYE